MFGGEIKQNRRKSGTQPILGTLTPNLGILIASEQNRDKKMGKIPSFDFITDEHILILTFLLNKRTLIP